MAEVTPKAFDELPRVNSAEFVLWNARRDYAAHIRRHENEIQDREQALVDLRLSLQEVDAALAILQPGGRVDG
jgi:hypothetical protein